MPAENTVALLTPPGSAAIAVVRLAGPGVAAFLARHFGRPAPPGRCVHGTLADERGDVLDDPVVVRSTSPAGEFADVSLHGGAWVVRSVIDLARRAGFRQAGGGGGGAGPPAAETSPVPGDVLVDAPAEVEREVLEYVPLARTGLALRTLLAQPAAWAALQARVTAAPAGDRAAALARVLDDRSLVHLLHPPRAAIVGAANVGKSTLANQLFAQERSITADLPGTTRDWVGEVADVDGLAVTLLDTPGVRETADALERVAIERGRAEVGRADLVVLVLDASRPLDPEQAPLRAAYPGALTVVNKVDRPAAWDLAAVDAIRTVASSGEGVDGLRDEIRRRFGCLGLDESQPRPWTERQRALLRRALVDATALREA
jgi:tRNA modification GTPase